MNTLKNALTAGISYLERGLSFLEKGISRFFNRDVATSSQGTRSKAAERSKVSIPELHRSIYEHKATTSEGKPPKVAEILGAHIAEVSQSVNKNTTAKANATSQASNIQAEEYNPKADDVLKEKLTSLNNLSNLAPDIVGVWINELALENKTPGEETQKPGSVFISSHPHVSQFQYHKDLKESIAEHKKAADKLFQDLANDSKVSNFVKHFFLPKLQAAQKEVLENIEKPDYKPNPEHVRLFVNMMLLLTTDSDAKEQISPEMRKQMKGILTDLFKKEAIATPQNRIYGTLLAAILRKE